VGKVTLLSASAVCLSLAASAFGVQQTEDFTVDPGWTGVGNTTYGFSNTNNAGGAPGEAGGAVPSRTPDITYYADTTLGGGLTQLDPITATGRFTISPRAGFDGGFAMGYFDSTGTVNVGQDGHFIEGIYMRVLDGDGTGYRVLASLSGQRSASDVINIAGGTDYLFGLLYEPTGVNATTARLTVEIRDAATPGTVLDTAIIEQPNNAGHVYDAFGIQTADFNTTVAPSDAFIDNLNYTVVPEPVAGALLVLGGLALLNGRRRVV
jgi:hypothetical protein